MFYGPLALLIIYGQRIQAWMILNDVSRSVGKLKLMKDRSRKEAVEFVTGGSNAKVDELAPRIDQFLEYFTIMPIDMDPSGVVGKLEHIMTTRDDRLKAEIRTLVPDADPIRASVIENLIEAASALNFIYKIVRHFYLIGKKTTSMFILAQLQMIMPMVLLEADALTGAIDAFKKAQPLGDGIGPMVVGRLMLDSEKKEVAKETVYSQSELKGRKVYLLTAKGPAGSVGQPGNGIKNMVEELDIKPNAIIMIDAALKLEGEKTGEIAEGIGAAIGGIGVDRFKIEEVATKHGIPLYAIVIKQSIVDAISVMRKEVAEAGDKTREVMERIVEEKTKEGDKIIIVGVGNTLGVAQ
ncbi:MAG: DUF1512 domain-containing protein [Nitrososphaerales archaeon]